MAARLRLGVEEERTLAERWRAHSDTRALGRLVEAHLGLVISIAVKYGHYGPPIEDLIQEGNIGLLIGARRFDPARGVRLATYATWWIRACIFNRVVRDCGGQVRVGTTHAQLKVFWGLRRAQRALGEHATPEALAALLDVTEQDLMFMLPRLARQDVSLDSPMSPQLGALHVDPFDTDSESIDDRIDAARERQCIQRALTRLTEREQVIIRERWLSETPVTLQVLADRFGVSRQAIEQAQQAAFKNLRRRLRVSIFRTIGSSDRP